MAHRELFRSRSVGDRHVHCPICLSFCTIVRASAPPPGAPRPPVDERALATEVSEEEAWRDKCGHGCKRRCKSLVWTVEKTIIIACAATRMRRKVVRQMHFYAVLLRALMITIACETMVETFHLTS